jgi:protein-tyrosine phosphatase
MRQYASSQGLSGRLSVGSAGTHALTGHGPTGEALSAARLWNLDIGAHRARQVDETLMSENDVVLAMTQRHHSWLTREFPLHRNKVYLTLLYPRIFSGESRSATDVPDPIGESVEFYLRVLEMLRPAVPKIAAAALGEEEV